MAGHPMSRGHLPEDIKILDSREVDADFHPRKRRCRKVYEYRLLNTIHPVPNYRLFSYFYYWKLDVGRMQEAEHDIRDLKSAERGH